MPPPTKSPGSVSQDTEAVDSSAEPLTTAPISQESSTGAMSESQQNTTSARPDIENLSEAVHGLDLSGRNNGDGSGSMLENRGNGVIKPESSFDDDQTHLSNSSTKQTSFDSKSMASVTTFAMDEKESLRPDDSASVQAAEEDESLSGPASGAPNSQNGSDAGARQFGDPYQRTPGVLRPGSRPLFTAADSNPNNYLNPGYEPDQTLHGFPKEPDDKLLEAMNSPKDRLLLLQLEDKIISFIKDSR